MSITIIDNQAIRLRLLTDIEADTCACSYKPFCQKVNKFDIGKFQVLTDNIITNGDFPENLDGWVIKEQLIVTLSLTNESLEDECDGEIVVTATGGDASYTYSIDGTNFQVSDTFSGLCVGCYNIIVKDSSGNLGFSTACIDTNVDCGSYLTPDLFDLKDIDLSKLINCELNDLI